MATRDYNFPTGFSTSSIPTPGDATNPEDFASYGQMQDEFAKRSSWYDKVADLTALKAVSAGDRSDGQMVFLISSVALYHFDSGSAAANDDDLVVQPDAGTGRWLKIETSGGGGGGGSGSVSGQDFLLERIRLEQQSLTFDKIEDSIYRSFVTAKTDVQLFLIEDYTASSTNMKPIINPTHLNSSDKNTDSTSGWSLGGAGATLTTSATKKIGSTSLSFDKGSGSVTAFISRTPSSISLSSNLNLWFWVNMPAVTNFTNIFVRVGTSSSNYATFTKTTDYAGSSVATGWNLMYVNLSLSPAASTGTGWSTGQSVSYFAVGVTTSSSGQTYTAILVDAIAFGDSSALYTEKGEEFSIYDSTHLERFMIDSTSTLNQGNVTLSAALSNSYSGGSSSILQRNMLTIDTSNKKATFTSGLSGNAITSQDFRTTRFLNLPLTSEDYSAVVTTNSNLYFTITEVNASTNIKVSSPDDLHLELLTGDIVQFFEARYSEGSTFVSRLPTGLQLTLTGNSTYSNGVLTLPMTTTTGAVVGYRVTKKSQIVPKISLVDFDENENYVNLTEDKVEVLSEDVGTAAGILDYWRLDGTELTSTVLDRVGSKNMPITGTMQTTTGKIFPLATGNLVDTTRVFGATTYSTFVRELSISCWIKAASASVSVNDPIFFGLGNAAYQLAVGTSSAGDASDTVNFDIGGNNFSSGKVLYDNNWHLVTWTYSSSGSQAKVYIDDTLTLTVNSVTLANAGGFYLGSDSSATTLVSGYFNQCIIWDHVLTLTEVQSLYNSGAGRTVATSRANLLYRLSNTSGLSGQKISMKVTPVRNTTAVDTYIKGLGIIKD